MSYPYWLLKLANRIGLQKQLYEAATIVQESGLFDRDWYQRELPLLRRALSDPVIDYLRRGADAGKDPHPLFDGRFYRSQIEDPAAAAMNPLIHYQTHGAASDLNPCRWFDSGWYRSTLTAPLEAGITPLRHFLERGAAQDRPPHPLFDLAWYRRRYPDPVGNGNPLADYLRKGTETGRVPHRAFDGVRPGRLGEGGIDQALAAALAVRDPPGPRKSSRKNFDSRRAAAFVTRLRERQKKRDGARDAPRVTILLRETGGEEHLRRAIDSVRAQSYPNWELIVLGTGPERARIIDSFGDARIHLLVARGGEAAVWNAGLGEAGGALIAYLDGDCTLSPEFLELMVALLESPRQDFVYSAARIESGDSVRYVGRRYDRADLARANYVMLSAVVHRRELLDKLGGFDESLTAFADWDLILRYAEKGRPKYAPFLGVTRRKPKQRRNHDAERAASATRHVVLNRSLIDWPKLAKAASRRRKLVSIVIPVHGNAGITNDCLESLYANRPQRAFEVVIVNNKSDAVTRAHLALWEQARSNLRVVNNWTNLNFALGCNVGFAASRGSIVVFLNNDTLLTPGWLDRLVSQLDDEAVGAVQPKLLYPDGTVQSVGAVFSDRSTLSYLLYRGEPGDAPHVNRRRVLQAIHGACLAMRAEDFIALRGFDPRFVNGQEDIDLCLRLTAESGKSCVVNPDSVVIHLEGTTRSRNPFLLQNRAYFVARWKGRVAADDVAIYAEDGMVAASYEADSENFAQRGVAVYTPRLTRDPSAPSGPAAAGEKAEARRA